MTSLSPVERETIILFNDEETTATVETCNKTWKNKMRALCAESADCSLVFADEHCERYLIPKTWVKVQKPRSLSDEQRRKLQDSARRNFCKGVQADAANKS